MWTARGREPALDLETHGRHTRFESAVAARAAALLAEAETASPGFRTAFWQGVADATRAFLLTMWKFRELLPAVMRDQRMGLRIGVLTRLPFASDLVVQGLPKIGLGGGPEAYFEVREAGFIVAGIRAAGVPGHPWAWNHPVRAALQFGPGPIGWNEIRDLSAQAAVAG